MIDDKREKILTRLMEIFAETPGIVEAVRNRQSVSAGISKRPAVIMHDAVEAPEFQGQKPKHATMYPIKLSPQIFVLLGDKSDVVGSKVSEIRAVLVPAIWTDSTLRTLCGGNGDIWYMGCGLDTTTGGTREAQLELKFEFEYVLNANELKG